MPAEQHTQQPGLGLQYPGQKSFDLRKNSTQVWLQMWLLLWLRLWLRLWL
jgi:hypothetical protein